MRCIALVAIVSSLAACGIGPITPRVTPTGSNPVAISDENPPPRERAAPAYASRSRARATENASTSNTTSSESELAVPVDAR